MSMFSIKYKFIFIHIPKNAGSTVNATLQKNCVEDYKGFELLNEEYGHDRDMVFGNHFTYSMIKEFIDKNNVDLDYGNYFKFCIVRNPWERMLSLYNHRMRKINAKFRGKPRNSTVDIKLLKSGFNNWLLKTQHTSDSVLTRTPQLTWIRGKENNIKCDKIIRIENLSSELDEIKTLLGLPNFQMKKANVSKQNAKLYQDHYSDLTRKHIEKYFEEDIDTFKFTY